MAAGACLLPFAGFAQSLQDQITAVDSVISQQTAEEEARQLKAEKQAAAREANRRAAQAQEAARVRAEKSADKQRAQGYEDKLRALELEEMSLNLEAKRARAKRADDFVEQELKAQAAQTDVLQSEADATRHISSGIGENLKSKGRAEESKAKAWW
ncbi:MAG: hypothetical protein DI628_08160 [Blastochloris viridis]|uniref:Uncharacterized protein n=1 Tax=Blastochloris viridis TaxID=1079 RepID=A0A6N4R124_BLAVI|nr:MAG: hypothetical protein DI628_08160 [Blastochloris viridis]